MGKLIKGIIGWVLVAPFLFVIIVGTAGVLIELFSMGWAGLLVLVGVMVIVGMMITGSNMLD